MKGRERWGFLRIRSRPCPVVSLKPFREGNQQPVPPGTSPLQNTTSLNATKNLRGDAPSPRPVKMSLPAAPVPMTKLNEWLGEKGPPALELALSPSFRPVSPIGWAGCWDFTFPSRTLPVERRRTHPIRTLDPGKSFPPDFHRRYAGLGLE